MKSTAKAESTMRVLVDSLKLKMASAPAGSVNTISLEKDAAGYPVAMISIDGDVAATKAVVLVKIEQSDAVSKDVLGNDLKAFAPHICTVCTEAGSALKKSDFAMIVAEIAKANVKVVEKETATNTAVTQASAAAAPVVATLDNPLWPNKGN